MNTSIMHPPKTNGGNFFVGAGDTDDSSATQNTEPTAVDLQVQTMTTGYAKPTLSRF